MELTPAILSSEIRRWFSTTIFPADGIDFTDQNLFRKILDLFSTDYSRYYDAHPVLQNILIRSELQGIILYRLARELFLKGNEACDDVAVLGRFLSGYEIYYSAEIGEGLKINHGIGTVIGARVVIGKQVTLHHGITLGDKNAGRPTLGDHIIIYPNSIIIGNIRIGDHSKIAAGAIVIHDVPGHTTVAGNPARIISNKKNK